MACAVRSCKSSYRNLKEQPGIISFHRFPSDPNLKLRWLNNIGRADWVPPKNARVCSLHFENESYKDGLSKKILGIYAVPTIFENQPANVKQETYDVRSRVPRSTRTLTSTISEPTKFSSHSQAPKKPKKRTRSETVSSELTLDSVASILYQAASKAQIAASTSQNDASTSRTDASTSQSVASNPQLELLSTIPKKKQRHAKTTKSTFMIYPAASTSKTALDEVPMSRVIRYISNSETENDENTVPSQTSGVTKSNEAAMSVASSIYHSNEKIRQLKSKLAHYKQLSERRGRKVKSVSRKYSRLLTKTASLETIIMEMKQRMDNEHIAILENAVDCPAHIFARYLMKNKGYSLPKEYPDEIKAFAVTLQFLSPRAYDYVRSTFNDLLPHPKTMSKWYQSIDCEPEFTRESFETINLPCPEATLDNKTLYCALSADETDSDS